MKRILVPLLAASCCPVAVIAAETEHGVNVIPDNFGLQVWVLLTFLVMFALLAKLAFKPIGEALDRRAQTIRRSLDEAEKSRAEAKTLMENYQRQLAEARAEAGRVVEEARTIGEKVRKEILEKTGTESAQLVQRAQEEIQRQKEKGIQELKDTVAGLSVQIASKVLEKEVNETSHRQLVENLIQDLSKVSKV